MYRKKDKKVMGIAAAAVVLFVALIYLFPSLFSFLREPEEVETEDPAYEVLIHKTDAGRIDVKKSLLKQDGDTETTLAVEAGTLVSLTVTPRADKRLDDVSVVDAKDFSSTFNTIINETKENTYIVDFSMPECDVVMTFDFYTVETEPPAKETEPEAVRTETETETESEKPGNPYGLTLHGITADLITSYNGLFDDRDFCRQLGDNLHLDSPRSEYYGITDVTFSREAYAGDQDSDKVYHYIYFGEDPEDRMLSTYYMKDDSYVFTRYAEPETEAKETQVPGAETGTGESTSGSSYGGSGYSSPGYSYSSPSSAKKTVTSLDILQVSKVFLDYTGDAEGFYQKAFDYVLSKGLTGRITGTMSSYDINTEKKKAVIRIRLSNGSNMKGTYDKKKNSFSFSGL